MEHKESYLSFKVGSEYYAANVSYVHNIIEHTKITKVPNMPGHLLGVINLRGQVLPVVDSRVKFGIEDTKITSNTCILVMEVKVDKEQVFVGALVDAVAEVIELSKKDIKAPPSIGRKMKNEFITGVNHDGDKFIMLLDMNRIFATTDIIDVAISNKQLENHQL